MILVFTKLKHLKYKVKQESAVFGSFPKAIGPNFQFNVQMLFISAFHSVPFVCTAEFPGASRASRAVRASRTWLLGSMGAWQFTYESNAATRCQRRPTLGPPTKSLIWNDIHVKRKSFHLVPSNNWHRVPFPVHLRRSRPPGTGASPPRPNRSALHCWPRCRQRECPGNEPSQKLSEKERKKRKKRKRKRKKKKEKKRKEKKRKEKKRKKRKSSELEGPWRHSWRM